MRTSEAPIRYRATGSELAQTYKHVVEEALQGRTDKLFTFIRVNQGAARLIINDPVHAAITATMGVDKATFAAMLSDNPHVEVALETMRANDVTPRWTAAHQAALYHPDLAKEMVAKGPAILNLRAMDISVGDVLEHTVREVRPTLAKMKRGPEGTFAPANGSFMPKRRSAEF